MGYLAETEGAITRGFATVAEAFGSGLLATFRPAFIVGFTVWITLIAYEVAFGKAEDGFTYLFTKIGKVFLIGVFALYGWPELAELFNGIKAGFVGDTTISTVLEANLINPMVDLWSALLSWITSTMEPYDITDLGKIVQALFIFGLLLVAYGMMALAVALFGIAALAMYMVASSTFLVLMAIGPFFLLCLAFPFTQRFFETYVGNVMTAIFGMALTALMVMFVSNFFGLTNIATVVPVATDSNTLAQHAKSMAVLFASKFGTALLIIYLTMKVFDLAAALGGGLNMGNNLVAGVRGIIRDIQRSAKSPGAAGHAPNQIAHNAATTSGGNPQRRAASANSTSTRMAPSANRPGRSFAYNRHTQGKSPA